VAGSAFTRREFLIGASTALGSLALGCSLSEIATPTRSLTPPPSPTPTPSPTRSPSPSATAPPLPLRRRSARLLVAGFRGRALAADDPILRAIADDGLGGVILFARNIESPAQLAELTATLRAAAGERPLLVAIDQEGGAVARLNEGNGFAATPSAAQVGRRGDRERAREVGRSIASTLAGTGINLNLAPVVDLNVNPENPSIGAIGRSYSADPDVVVEMAGAFVDGHREHGVLTALKHFAGLGSATGDTDREFVDVSGTWTEIELDPFRRLIEGGRADLVMVGNALNDRLDPRHPAALSVPTLRTLREDLGWGGVVITDDLMAGALRENYDQSEVLRLAIPAGCDLLLLANTGRRPADVVQPALDAIVRLVDDGRLDERLIDQSLARIDALFARSG
jgi:beta-N-acetylhexosaminidase